MQDLKKIVFVSRASCSKHEVLCEPLRRLGNGRYGFPKLVHVGSCTTYGIYNASSSIHGICQGEVHFRNEKNSCEFEIMPNDYIVFHDNPSHVTFSKFQWCYALFK
jgi:hypothetical protein